MGIMSRNRSAEEVLVQLKGLSESLHDEIQPFVQRYHDARFGSKRMSVEELSRYKKLIHELEMPPTA